MLGVQNKKQQQQYFGLFPDFFILALPPLIKSCRKLSLNRSLHGFALHDFPFTFHGFWSKSRYICSLLDFRFTQEKTRVNGELRVEDSCIFFSNECIFLFYFYLVQFVICNYAPNRTVLLIKYSLVFMFTFYAMCTVCASDFAFLFSIYAICNY